MVKTPTASRERCAKTPTPFPCLLPTPEPCERQKHFLQYCQRMIRENFVLNFGLESRLNYMTAAESRFSRLTSTCQPLDQHLLAA